MSVREKLNCRKILYQLSTNPLVESAKISYYFIRIKFTTGLWENWYRCHSAFRTKYHLPEDPYLGDQMHIGYQFEFNDLDPNYDSLGHLFEMRFSHWKMANFVERRLAVHRLIKLILERGWKSVRYPDVLLHDDLRRLVGVDLVKKHLKRGIITPDGNYGRRRSPGKLLMEQFLLWATKGKRNIRVAWQDPAALRIGIESLLRKKLDVNRHNLLVELGRFPDYHYRRVCPNFYRYVFRRFGLQDLVVADPFPGAGSKAIAAALEGLHYHADLNLDCLGKFLRVDFDRLDRDYYDLVLLDNNMDLDVDLETQLSVWGKKADLALVFVPARLHGVLPKPQKFAQIGGGLSSVDYAYLYC